MMMLQCSAAHFTTNSFSYRIKNLIVPFTIRQILQVCIYIRCVLSVSTLSTSTRAIVTLSANHGFYAR